MERLIQLPNGDWIDPLSVIAIRVGTRHQCDITQTLHAPRVIVDYRMGDRANVVACDCESNEDAFDLRDRLAAQVNEVP